MNEHRHGKRNELVQIKMSSEEKSLLRQAAILDGEQQFTTWARAVLNRKVSQVLEVNPGEEVEA